VVSPQYSKAKPPDHLDAVWDRNVSEVKAVENAKFPMLVTLLENGELVIPDEKKREGVNAGDAKRKSEALEPGTTGKCAEANFVDAGRNGGSPGSPGRKQGYCRLALVEQNTIKAAVERNFEGRPQCS